jgi:alpha-glucosidase
MLDRLVSSQDWWRGAVIYQIYPRSFADTNGDGIGDLPGVTAHLDHVARLGVDAIWLSPVFTSPQRDFGYDVSDHTAIDPIFGTLEDFDAMVARAHVLGLRVIIDQVWSHTSDKHPWFTESRHSRKNSRADWYVWADPSPDGTPPNNWLSVFGGAAWTWEPRRRQYYLHHFLAHQPQLNLHNPAVQDALLESGRFWLDRGVDGFRLDALDFFTHDPALRSNPAAPPGPPPAKLFNRQVHAHDMIQPQTHDFLGRIRELMDSYPGTATLGEVSSQDGAYARCRSYSQGGKLNMAYSLRATRQDFGWAGMRALVAEAARAEAGWLCWSFSNHDVERAISRWNPAPVPGQAPDPRFARLLMALQLSLRGSVLVYQGEELGLTEAQLAADELQDPFGIAYWPEFRGRDGSRTPMPWVAKAPQAGFSAGKPWLPAQESHLPLAVDVQERDPSALLHAWRRLLSYRRAHPALASGGLEMLDLPEPLIGYVRRDSHEQVLCLFNLSAVPVVVPADAGGPRSLGPYGTAFVASQSSLLRPVSGDLSAAA